jgi:hypothetical protein
MQRLLFLLTLCLLAETAPAADRVFDFSETNLNGMPRGFHSTVVGSGQPGEWKVIWAEVPSLLEPLSPNATSRYKRPVLAQTSRDPTDEHFPLLTFEDEVFGDFLLTTRFKIVEGEKEQMAGIAFRVQDERNYYYMRASALGGNFAFLKVVEGERSSPLGVPVTVAQGVWHELAVECKGTRIRGWLDGKEAFPALDDKSFASGKIGFITKSDSLVHFIDARLTYTPKESLAQLLVKDAFKKFPRLKGLKIFAADVDGSEVRAIASLDPADIGQPAPNEERDVIARGAIYHGKGRHEVVVSMPLHDSNGDTVAAVRVVMKPFPGQTENNAIARAMPIVKQMEPRVQKAKDLFQ